MRVYFDTKDLINILDGSNPCTADSLTHRLRQGGHELLISVYTVVELSEPLNHPASRTNVMGLLNYLEEMPLCFINSSAIPRLELGEALQAFADGREYSAISPFVKRFDETVDLYGQPPTRLYMSYSLGEAVWDLYTSGALSGLDAYAERMRQSFASDRALPKQPSLKSNFTKMIERNLSLHKVPRPVAGVAALADWIYVSPTRCPSVRLVYEVWHKMLKNTTDVPDASDLEDLQHLACLPYIDLMSVDRRMHGYISQAAAGLGLSYGTRIARTAQEILHQL